jgi:hypothetical protein
MATARYGLRTTIRLHGTVIDQRVAWSPSALRSAGWLPVGDGVPTKDGRPLGYFRWVSGGAIEWRSGSALNEGADEQCWVWSNGDGVDLTVDRIRMRRAQRTSSAAFGDLALLVMMLTMFVGLAQANLLIRAIVGPTVSDTTAFAPSPELIARLLRRELSGEATGTVAHTQRPEFKTKRPSIYLPAGSKGPLDHAGGGARSSEHPVRTPPVDDVSDGGTDGSKHAQNVSPASLPVLAQAPVGQVMTPTEGQASASERTGLPRSIERFIGWGFHDWMDASQPATQEVVEQLELARQLMRIDPDQPYAILTVAYYAYLSEEYTLCQDLYRRYVTLFPEEAAGWNNLALTHKRSGDYREEERLYRRALSLEPGNANTKNNLAVNLAHQGRFAEAEHMMDGLEAKPEERPYANLHRAKIAAAQGQDRRAYKFLKKALAGVDAMDTFHHIEFRQDIRIDPSLDDLRRTKRVQRLLKSAYGDDSPLSLGSQAQPRRADG